MDLNYFSSKRENLKHCSKQQKNQRKKYFVLTLHRPANVDKENKLKEMMQAITDNTRKLPIIFPAHPRTAKIL